MTGSHQNILSYRNLLFRFQWAKGDIEYAMEVQAGAGWTDPRDGDDIAMFRQA